MKYAFLVLVLVMLLAVGASASIVSFTPSSTGLSKTDWSSSLALQQFDPSLGTLNSIQFWLDGHLEGSAKFESRDAEPSTVTMNLSAILKLKRPDNSNLVAVNPFVPTSDAATAWDGTNDYAGTSGKTYANLTADASNTWTTSSASDIALFTGLGYITLPVTATGASTGSGPGNLWMLFRSNASASARITYDYTAVPEPGSMAAAFALLAPAVLVIRRRRA